MKIKILIAAIPLLALGACEVYVGPPSFIGNVFKSESDTSYYRSRARVLVGKLTRKVEEYEINRIAVIDLVDSQGRVPVLGEYLASRLVEEITRKKIFRVAQKGEVQEALDQLDLGPALSYSKEETQQLGDVLNAQALLNGKITDLGSNLDIQLFLVDIVTGEIIASVTEPVNRNKFAMEMLRHFI